MFFHWEQWPELVVVFYVDIVNAGNLKQHTKTEVLLFKQLKSHKDTKIITSANELFFRKSTDICKKLLNDDTYSTHVERI